MENYFQMLNNIGPVAYVLIVLFILLLAGGAWWGLMKNKPKAEEEDLPRVVKKKVVKTDAEEDEEESGMILGKGKYKCVCFCPGNVLDFTTIPEPIGEIYQFDTSNPISGAGYIVQQTKDGDVIDYDPREVPVNIETSPELAWFAIKWDIVKTVFNVPLQWWKSTSTWFAVGMIAVTFICALVVLE